MPSDVTNSCRDATEICNNTNNPIQHLWCNDARMWAHKMSTRCLREIFKLAVVLVQRFMHWILLIKTRHCGRRTHNVPLSHFLIYFYFLLLLDCRTNPRSFYRNLLHIQKMMIPFVHHVTYYKSVKSFWCIFPKKKNNKFFNMGNY